MSTICEDIILRYPDDIIPELRGSVGLAMKLSNSSKRDEEQVAHLSETMIEWMQNEQQLVKLVDSRGLHFKVLNLCLESERLVEDAKDKQLEATVSGQDEYDLESPHLNRQSLNLHLQSECRTLQAEIKSAQAENKMKICGSANRISRSRSSSDKISRSYGTSSCLNFAPLKINLQLEVTYLFLEAIRLKLLLEFAVNDIHIAALRNDVKKLRRIKRKAEYLEVQAQGKELEADNKAAKANLMFKLGDESEDESDFLDFGYSTVACWKATAEILHDRRRDRVSGDERKIEDRHLNQFLTDVNKLLQLDE